MKQYKIDELRYQDYEKIKDYLDENYGPTQMEGIYWISLDEDLLDEIQSSHRDCKPHCFAVELKEDEISLELLIRTRGRMRCDCIRYANREQREHIFNFAETMFASLKILT